MTRLIAIAGGSGAGKSTIAAALARTLRASILAEDDYYRCASAIENFDADTHNFDAPETKDHALLAAHLSLAKKGQSFDKPSYDLTTHLRRAETEPVAPGPALIVEGLHVFATPVLRALYDVRVFVEADEAVRLERRMARDVIERRRSPHSVEQQLRLNVFPMHVRHVEPQRAFADLVLTSPADADAAHAEAAAAAIIALLEQR